MRNAHTSQATVDGGGVQERNKRDSGSGWPVAAGELTPINQQNLSALPASPPASTPYMDNIRSQSPADETLYEPLRAAGAEDERLLSV